MKASAPQLTSQQVTHVTCVFCDLLHQSIKSQARRHRVLSLRGGPFSSKDQTRSGLGTLLLKLSQNPTLTPLTTAALCSMNIYLQPDGISHISKWQTSNT